METPSMPSQSTGGTTGCSTARGSPGCSVPSPTAPHLLHTSAHQSSTVGWDSTLPITQSLTGPVESKLKDLLGARQAHLPLSRSQVLGRDRCGAGLVIWPILLSTDPVSPKANPRSS